MSINGEPGLVSFLDGKPLSVTSFETNNGKIVAVYTVLNPTKLTSIPPIKTE